MNISTLPSAGLVMRTHSSDGAGKGRETLGDAGAKRLRALGAKGDEADLRSASYEFSGHCLAVTRSQSWFTVPNPGCSERDAMAAEPRLPPLWDKTPGAQRAR
jgi:hypothetical protein